MITVSVHGRSGQGVDTAVSALAKAAFSSGFFTQSVFFPSEERRGAHVWGLVKLDKGAILSKQLEQPDMALVFAANLDIKAIASGVKEKGIIIFNSGEKILLPAMKKNKIKSYSLDATGIAMRTIGRPIPNAAMLGAAAKHLDKVSLKGVKSALAHLDKENLTAVDEGFRVVK